MADKADKNENNVAGKFYVDKQCIECGLCNGTAPDIFAMGDGGAYVARQPENDEEVSLTNEAKDSCPVQAIGDDGE